MKTSKFKISDFLIIAIIIIIIFCIVLWNWDQPEQDKEKEKESRLSYLAKKLQAVSEQLDKEMQSLRLTKEMRVFVDKRIDFILLIGHIAVILIGIAITMAIHKSGQDLVTSALSATGIMTLLFLISSMLIVKRFVDANVFVDWVRSHISKWVFKKYGYDPSEEVKLQESINQKENESKLITEEINKINISTP